MQSSVNMGRSFRLGSYLLWGHFTGGAGRLALQLAQAALQFAECGVKGGAQGARAPGFPGNANPGWRTSAPRQKNLAVPIPGGEGPFHAKKHWQCQN